MAGWESWSCEQACHRPCPDVTGLVLMVFTRVKTSVFTEVTLPGVNTRVCGAVEECLEFLFGVGGQKSRRPLVWVTPS